MEIATTPDAAIAAEDADVANTAETTTKEATTNEAANKEPDQHSNHESIAGRMAYAPKPVPPAPPRRDRPPNHCNHAEHAEWQHPAVFLVVTGWDRRNFKFRTIF